MNILYLSPATRPDYQCDMLLHGLRTFYGAGVVDCPRVSFLYDDYHDTTSLYGRGFTLYGLLPDIDVDRSGVKQRIANKEFDLIIYGSIQRSQQFFDLVVAHYPREKVIFVDGEDHPGLFNLSKHGLYFKRELVNAIEGIHPIHFAIPTAKIGTIKPTVKSKVRAHIDPRERSTYIYKTEREYYQDYSESLFAFTMRKAGWDSLRHLEIMANGCIPLFLDLADCPELTCIHLPKPELLEALTYADRDGAYWDTPEGRSLWKSLWRRIHLKFSLRCTTERLAQYVIETQAREAQKAA